LDEKGRVGQGAESATVRGSGTLVGFWVSAKKAKSKLKIVNAHQRIVDLFLRSNLAPMLEGHSEFLGITPD
jgi:hypothetical protein